MRAGVEPARDVLSVAFGQMHRLGRVRRTSTLQELGELLEDAVSLASDFDPAVLGVLLRPFYGLTVRFGLAPFLPHLVLVLRGVEISEDFKALFVRHGRAFPD